jgi:hypothetical protein
MTGHIRERVLLLARDKRVILCRKHPEQDPDQDHISGASGAPSASQRHARFRLNLEADPMPGDSRAWIPAGPIAALCEATVLLTLRPAPFSARAAARRGRSPIRPVLTDLAAVRGIPASPPGLAGPRHCTDPLRYHDDWPACASFAPRRSRYLSTAATAIAVLIISPSAGSSRCCDASGTRASGEQAHMTSIRPHLTGNYPGSILPRGDQLLCHQ